MLKEVIIIFLIAVIIMFIQFALEGLGPTLHIDLSGYDTSSNAVFKGYYYFSNTSNKVKIKITGISDSIGYLIVQAHSFIHNLTLASDRLYVDKITGNNIGLYYGNNYPNVTFYLRKETNISINVLLVVTLHHVRDPIPGGCNLLIDNEIAPYQKLSYDEDLITVECQAPSIIGFSCDSNKVAIEVYHMYLTDNLSESHYFNSIELMVSVDSIKKMGTKVGRMDGKNKYKILFSAYQGTGEVFAIIAVYEGRSAAYVPVVSYACDLNNASESCNRQVTEYWMVIRAVAFLGLFINFFGHTFFKTSVFFNGFITGVSISLYYFYDITTKVKILKLVIMAIVGLNCGVIWLFIWWKFRIPVLSIILSFILSGFLLSSIVFYSSGLADFPIFHNDFNFWRVFVCYMICNIILCMMSKHEGHIFCCSLLGSSMFILTVNYYFGGHLQYIIINTYRRLTVKDFNAAVIDPPFERIDYSLALLWVVLIVFGVNYQNRCQIGKPQFPSHI